MSDAKSASATAASNATSSAISSVQAPVSRYCLDIQKSPCKILKWNNVAAVSGSDEKPAR